MLSPSSEDYLKAVYELQHEQSQPWATTSALAQELDVAPASVTEMLKRLAAVDPPLITYERYRGARLTPIGELAALQVVRAHRLLEQFLTVALGYRWDEVHEEAHRLEHAMSARLGERIAAYLGHPGSDPHGDPIPGPDGELAPRHDTPLAELSAGEGGRITRVHSHDSALLRYLGDLGIYPAAFVRVVEVSPFGGPLTLRIGERSEVIGRAVAGRVSVEVGGESSHE